MRLSNRASFFTFLVFQTAHSYASPIVDSAKPIPDSPGVSYGVSNLIDKNRLTAYCVPNNEKMWIKFKIKGSAGFGIVNGYDKSNKLFKANSRPKDIIVTKNNKQIVATLQNSNYPQWISLWTDDDINDDVMLNVNSVYSGRAITATSRCTFEALGSRVPLHALRFP